MIPGAVLAADRAAFAGADQPTTERLVRSIVGVRPEHVDVAPLRPEGVPGVVEIIERVGAETLIGCRLRIGERCSLRLDTAAIPWFDEATGERRDDGADSPVAAGALTKADPAG